MKKSSTEAAKELPNGGSVRRLVPPSAYDEATHTILMGHLCDVSDFVMPSRVRAVATAIMTTMANRKKPDPKSWRNTHPSGH